MKRIILFIVIFSMVVLFMGCEQHRIYVDNKNNDLEELKNKELDNNIEKYSEYIVDEIYINDTKIVGFSSSTTQGVFVYEKDIEGNYIINQSNKIDIFENNLGVSNYRIIYDNYENIEKAKYGYIIISNGKKVSKVEITINEKYKYTEDIVLGKPSMILIKEDLDDEENDAIRLEVKYFDENNNELQQ